MWRPTLGAQASCLCSPRTGRMTVLPVMQLWQDKGTDMVFVPKRRTGFPTRCPRPKKSVPLSFWHLITFRLFLKTQPAIINSTLVCNPEKDNEPPFNVRQKEMKIFGSIILTLLGVVILVFVYGAAAMQPAGMHPTDRQAFDQGRILGACVTMAGMICLTLSIAFKIKFRKKDEAQQSSQPYR
jgi:hypothetical protein